MIQTINPTRGEKIKTYETLSPVAIEDILEKSHRTFLTWRNTDFSLRAQKMKKVAELLLKNKESYGHLISQEMGKLPDASIAEIEKCAWVCEYFSTHAEQFLSPKIIKTDMLKSFVAYRPLGIILAIMPWNFPFWQVFRFAAPAIMAGNTALLKHAPITTGCALAIEAIFKEAFFPEPLFRTLLVKDTDVENIIKHPHIAAVTVTASQKTGRSVASVAGHALKKVVLELGGSDPYIILEDANLEQAADRIVQARMHVSGQSCIAPKRILALESIRSEFEKKVLEKIEHYKIKINLGPMAREDLRAQLHQQIQDSVAQGAKLITGGFIPKDLGFYYPATVLTNVKKGMPAYDEELFGPVITFIDVKTEQEAIHIANNTSFGLGAAIFTSNLERGERIAVYDIEAGSCFINDFVKSDPRLPFGGIKGSGFGRELSEEGIKEFVNVKTVAIGILEQN